MSAASLRSYTATLPSLPGAYLMRDASGQVIYVGKAKNLRERVRNYATGDERLQIDYLLRKVVGFIEDSTWE